MMHIHAKASSFFLLIDLFDRPFLDPHKPWGLVALCKHVLSVYAILPVIEKTIFKK